MKETAEYSPSSRLAKLSDRVGLRVVDLLTAGQEGSCLDLQEEWPFYVSKSKS